MSLVHRYHKLTLWNKLAVWGSIASLVGIALAVYPFLPNTRVQSEASVPPLTGNIEDNRSSSFSGTQQNLNGNTIINNSTVSLVSGRDTSVASIQDESDPKQKLEFRQIEINDRYCLWKPIQRPCRVVAPLLNPGGKPWNFGGPYRGKPRPEYPLGSHQLLTLNWTDSEREADLRIADPIIDVTVVNVSKSPSIVTALGIEPVAAWTAPKGPPLVVKLTEVDCYSLQLDGFDLGKRQQLKIESPLLLEPNAAYRYRLRLKEYATAVGHNESVLRLAIEVDQEVCLSQEIYLGMFQVPEKKSE